MLYVVNPTHHIILFPAEITNNYKPKRQWIQNHETYTQNNEKFKAREIQNGTFFKDEAMPYIKYKIKANNCIWKKKKKEI